MMTNWLSTMQQTFEYYIVDPNTWRDVQRIDTILSSSINRDLNAETLGSASITITQSLGECYIRIYLVTIQNKIKERHPLGTFLVQTPAYSFDGKITNVTMDAYTPLLELKENLPPLGYSILKGSNIMDTAYDIINDHARAPVIKTTKSDTLFENFIANPSDTWMTFVTDLIANAKYTLQLDDMGRILFDPKQDTQTLQPVWTYDDSNSSILYPTLDIDHDMYGIPNVVEVIYSNGGAYYHGVAKNTDESSPISIQNRGREITHRVTNPDLMGNPTENQVQLYAERLLREMSALEYTITYTHAYCPVRIGDCIRLNYSRAGMTGIKAKVVSQSIKCEPGCPVVEKAIFTTELWR